jgi:hypothetical protein
MWAMRLLLQAGATCQEGGCLLTSEGVPSCFTSALNEDVKLEI